MIIVLCLLILALTPVVSANAGTKPADDPITLSTPPESQGIGIRLLDIPAATQDDPRARTYIVDRIAPGTEISRRIQVENNTDSTQSVRIYPGAAHIEDGTFVGEDDPSENELTTWTTADQEVLELPAGQSGDVAVSIKVPSDAPEGEQYGAVWAEMRSTSAGEGNIIQASRVGIRIYLSVGEGNGPPADFSIDSLTAARDPDGNPQVSASVTNTGGRALDVIGDLMLTEGPGGISTAATSAQQATTLAPGSTGEVTVAFDAQLPDGPWTVIARLQSGLIEQEAEAQITFPAAGETETPITAESSLPWAPIAIATSAVTLLLIALLLWHRHRRNHQRSTS